MCVVQADLKVVTTQRKPQLCVHYIYVSFVQACYAYVKIFYISLRIVLSSWYQHIKLH